MPALLRCFLVVLNSALLLGLLPAATQARELRISHQWAAGKDARDQAARIFAAEIAKRRPELQISIRADSSMGFSPAEQFDAMRDGRVEMAIFPMFYLSPRIPELSITLLPGLPASTQQAQLLKGTAFHRQLQALCETLGFRILTWWWLEGGIVAVQPIDGPLSVKGLKVRSGDPMFDLMFKSLGAEPRLMASPLLAAALKDGSLHVALASLESLVSLGIAAQSTHAVIGGHALYVSLHPLMISTKVWAGLSDVQRKAIEEAADVADVAFLGSQIDAEKSVREELRRVGASIRSMPFDEYQEWLENANETSWKAYRAISPTASELLSSMLRGFIESKRSGN